MIRVSDSDDGYGDSSDLLYDAEEEDGLTSLTSEVKEVLGGNVNVVDLTAEQHQEDDSEDYLSIKESLDVSAQDDSSRGYKTLGVSNNKINWDDDNSDYRRTEVPKLQLGDDQDASHLNHLEDQTGTTLQVPSDKTLFEADDSGLADLEAFIKDSDASEILENLLEEESHLEDEDDGKQSAMSLVEVSERVHIDRGLSSLGDEVNDNLKLSERELIEETNSDTFFQRRESKEFSEPSNFQLPARSDADFASLDYSDDFEDFQDEPECTEMEKQEDEEERSPAPAGSPQVSPVHSKAEPEMPPEAASKTQSDELKQGSKHTVSADGGVPQTPGHRSRRDQGPRKAPGSGVERSSRRPESKSPSDGDRSSATMKGKRVAAGPPLIKPALLSSERLKHVKTSDSSRPRSKNSTASKSRPRSTVSSSSSSSSSSPLSSASSSSSSSSSLSSRSSPHTRGRRGRASISGPVRPTTHKSPVGHRVDGVRGVSSSPVRPPTNAAHHSLTLTPTNPAPAGRVAPAPGVRAAPPARVRKAASASDLHK